MFFSKKNSTAQYGSFDMQSIEEMDSSYQNSPYSLSNKFIKTVVITVISVHVFAIAFFALQGLISDFFKPKEKSITINLTDFAAYAPVKNDQSSEQFSQPDLPTPDTATIDTAVPIPDPVVTKEFTPQAKTQPMFDAPTLAAVPKPREKPKKPKVKPRIKPRTPTTKPPRKNNGKKTSTTKNLNDKSWTRIGNTGGTDSGTSAQMKSYGAAVGKQLRRLFTAPSKQQAKYQILKVVVKIRISSTGRIIRTEILRRSGNIFMDNAVTTAINMFYNKQLPQAPPNGKIKEYEIIVTNIEQN